jgi:hypothetical protein
MERLNTISAQRKLEPRQLTHLIRGRSGLDRDEGAGEGTQPEGDAHGLAMTSTATFMMSRWAGPPTARFIA